MPKIKQLSGKDVVKILQQFGVEIHSQKGSDIKLRTITETGKEILTIPNHKSLDLGTCQAIFKQACKYLLETDLYKYFYH